MFPQILTPIIEIDPSDRNLTAEKKEILFHYLNETQQQSCRFILEDTVYTEHKTDEYGVEKDVYFKFSKNLLLTTVKDHEYRYQVFSFNNQIGSGGYGLIFKGDAKIIIDKEKHLSFKDSHYVIKMQPCIYAASEVGPNTKIENYKNFHANLNTLFSKLNKTSEWSQKSKLTLLKFENEVELTKQSGLKVKTPLLITADAKLLYSFTPLEFCGGDELYNYLVKDEEVPIYSVDARIELALQIARAFKSQVHDKKIIHRDIKLENIMIEIDESGYICAVKFIDFNLSKKAEAETHNIVGTLEYMSPETFNAENVDISADIFALGKVFSFIFRARPDNPNSVLEAYQKSLFSPMKEIFRDLNIPDPEKKELLNLFRQMLSPDPIDRPSVEQVIEKLEMIQISFIINNVLPDAKADKQATKAKTFPGHSSSVARGGIFEHYPSKPNHLSLDRPSGMLSR